MIATEKGDRTRAIVLRIEDNTAVLINDFETNHARVEFGPAKVMLRPYEDVTVLDLSGSTPKRPRQLKVLMLRLGPDFATDLFEVATRDHARLRIKLSYKWQFDVQGDPEKDKSIFRVNDFIGYVCENLASRIRQVAAENEFETFHKNASVLIRRAIFGMDDAGRARKDRLFSENQLRIIDIDIKDIAPVDEKTALKLREAIDTNIQIQLDASRQEAQAAVELKRIRSEEEKQLADIASHRKSEAERQSLIELQSVDCRCGDRRRGGAPCPVRSSRCCSAGACGPGVAHGRVSARTRRTPSPAWTGRRTSSPGARSRGSGRRGPGCSRTRCPSRRRPSSIGAPPACRPRP
ncbi:hypothetical protein EJ065_4675 [Corallococcus coralloides]|uniref:Band 7 domain-containing protein n=1 Tax=Corallococcus coralloides TaxID=184914 RepID=A0A410RWG9_CORCK|nr:hypothetical protein EJ065_4675 [Corallococcus coralloides]